MTKISDHDISLALELLERIEKGLPPRNEQEAKDMEEAKSLMALVDAFVKAPKGASGEQTRSDTVEAARTRIFGKQN